MTRPLLAPGARVGVFAPSGNYDPERLEAGFELLRRWGLEPVPAPGLGSQHRYLAGTDEQRLAGLRWALEEPGLGAAWLARGGYGLSRLLPRIPWGVIAARPVIGFSDATALFSGLWSRSAGIPVHGPVLHSLADHADGPSREATRALLLEGRGWQHRARVLVGGRAEGPLVGGNLCTLASLAGTPWALDARGAVLLLEEVGERPYRVDRLLTQLRDSGALEGVAAVVLGEFVGCEEARHPGWDPVAIAGEILESLGVPVVAGAPVGHGPSNRPFVWGAPASVRDGVLSWSLG